MRLSKNELFISHTWQLHHRVIQKQHLNVLVTHHSFVGATKLVAFVYCGTIR